ncbi:MAG TPA: RsmE family RNA methyltransferase [Vicinamibacteria bacterium]|nr:RsmE family RNA methyltransferase [Vicinamibacteria bacterium]
MGSARIQIAVSRERRFFVRSLDSDRIELRGDEAHHIIHVLRLVAGARITLFDGRGRAVRAAIESLTGDSVSVRVMGSEPPRESPFGLALGLAVPKSQRMPVAVQKLTELGARRIIPLVTERGTTTPSQMQRSLARWRRIVLEASKQSRRSLLVEVSPPRTLLQALDQAEETWIVMAQPGAPALEVKPTADAVLALIGPEGGWSETELTLARKRSVVLYGLGPRTLRTETAAITTAAILQWNRGDLRY